MVASRKVTSLRGQMMRHAIDRKCHERHCRVASKDLDRRVSVHVKDGAVHTPFAAKAMMSADPFPLMSASWRGKALSLFQPPALAAKGRELECRRCKVPASGREGHIDTVSTEADDVGFRFMQAVEKLRCLRSSLAVWTILRSSACSEFT